MSTKAKPGFTPSLKMTTLTMDWTETGATVFYESSNGFGLTFNCPRCHAPVYTGTEHRCGDRIKRKPTKKAGVVIAAVKGEK